MHNHPSIFLIGNEFQLQDTSKTIASLLRLALTRREKQIRACPPRRASGRQASPTFAGSRLLFLRRGKQGSLRSLRAGGMTGRNTQAEACATQSGVKPPHSKRQKRIPHTAPVRPVPFATTLRAGGMTSKKAKRRGEILRARNALRMTQKPQSVGRGDTLRYRGNGKERRTRLYESRGRSKQRPYEGMARG